MWFRGGSPNPNTSNASVTQALVERWYVCLVIYMIIMVRTRPVSDRHLPQNCSSGPSWPRSTQPPRSRAPAWDQKSGATKGFAVNYVGNALLVLGLLRGSCLASRPTLRPAPALSLSNSPLTV